MIWAGTPGASGPPSGERFALPKGPAGRRPGGVCLVVVCAGGPYGCQCCSAVVVLKGCGRPPLPRVDSSAVLRKLVRTAAGKDPVALQLLPAVDRLLAEVQVVLGQRNCRRSQ